MEIINALRKHHLFLHLDENYLQLIADITHTELFDIDQVVFYEGDDPHYFYLLHSGLAKIFKVDPKGTEIVLHNFVAPSLIAEMASIGNFRFPATCVATEPATFLMIQKEPFISLLQNNAKISFGIIRSLTQKIKGMDMLLNKSLIFDAATKVAHYIYENPEDFVHKKNKIIATELHITPETLSRVLKKLKDLQIIDPSNRLIDKEKLKLIYINDFV